jgi:ectoine hydroxylase-related dioxygenase (phytanoyl-CoA dioxygenase family)
MQAAPGPIYDEAAYLAEYPDVAAAVASGHVPSGWRHFLQYGQFEGRRIAGFDAGFYTAVHALVAEDIAQGRARHPFEHYLTLGRGRGYLPYPSAPRPANAAFLPSKFGGFWVDQLNALDLVDGRLETGRIDSKQASLLRAWIKDGFVVIPGALPAEMVALARHDFDTAWRGAKRDALFECEAVLKTRAPGRWKKAMTKVSAKALDLHFHSQAIRDLIFAPAVTAFLEMLFDAPAYASQSLGFYLGSGQEGHQDSAYVAYSIPRQFCASWIALEDVTPGGGELFYYPGSHRLPEFLYESTQKGIYEAMRLNGGVFPAADFARHPRWLEAQAKERGLRREVLLAKAGDVLFWHADLVHGGSAINPAVTRKSLVTHYCPKYVAPLQSDVEAARLYRHGRHLFSSGYYKGLEPAA